MTSLAVEHCRIALPADWPRPEMLAFHRRGQPAASDDLLEMALLWGGAPARLQIAPGPQYADVQLQLAARPLEPPSETLQQFVQRIFGLLQPVNALQERWGNDPQLGPLLRRQPGLRIPQAPTPFDALTWAVIGQQISVQAATSIRARLIRALGEPNSEGQNCPPDASRLAQAALPTLRAAGLSRSKAETLQRIAAALISGELPLGRWLQQPPASETLRQRLLDLRGVGPWTANYTLLRGFGDLDSSLHGDLGVQRNLQRLLNRSTRVSAAEAEAWLEPFRPWRALVAVHLWSLSG